MKLGYIFASTALLLVVGTVIFSPHSQTTHYVPLADAKGAPESDAATQIKDYKQWYRVNPEPVDMSPAVAAACAPGFNRKATNPPSANKKSRPRNPHRNMYLTVYVNEIGKAAMLTEGEPVFPVGSIVVKEKLSTPESETPNLLTAMIKHEKGYDEAHGDWEYLLTDGTASKVEEGGKLPNCQSCHDRQKANDYIYRTYLP